VLGSIPELGSWKTYMHHLEWTEGHIWVSEDPLLTKYPYFAYKYVLLDDEKTTFIGWETGINRLCDCRLLSKTTQQAIM